MATYTQLVDRITAWLRAEASAEAQAQVPRWLADAQRELEDRATFRVLRRSTLYTTAEDTRELGDLPGDWQRPFQQPRLIWGSGATEPIAYLADFDAITERYSDQPTEKGRPRHLFIRLEDASWKLDVYPLPDALNPSGAVYSDGHYRIQVPYIRRISPLDPATNPENWWSLYADRALEYMAVAEGLDFDLDEQRAAYWQQKARREMRRLQAREARYQLADVETLAVSKGAAARGRP